MHATRAAVEEGIVPGGGAALIYALKKLDNVKYENEDQRVGIAIVRRALVAPCFQIAENAGTEGAVVVGKLLESSNDQWGFDAQTGTYCNLAEKGIIDPAKVVRTALQDASSVAGLLITTEAMVAEKPEPKGSGPAGGPPGGDMGARRHGLLGLAAGGVSRLFPSFFILAPSPVVLVTMEGGAFSFLRRWGSAWRAASL